MTERQTDRRQGPRRALTIILSLVAFAALLALAVVAAIMFASASMPSNERPVAAMIDFTHQKHIAAGVPCLFCHPQARNGPVASLPSAQKCVGCHQSIQVGSQAGQSTITKLLGSWQAGRPLRWPKVVDLPDFVNFNHRPHIAAGKNCEQCHGNVGAMDMVHVVHRINMGFCLNNCHRHQDEVKRERLMSCTTCHK